MEVYEVGDECPDYTSTVVMKYCVNNNQDEIQNVITDNET